jgi:hypothetical protein
VGCKEHAARACRRRHNRLRYLQRHGAHFSLFTLSHSLCLVRRLFHFLFALSLLCSLLQGYLVLSHSTFSLSTSYISNPVSSLENQKKFPHTNWTRSTAPPLTSPAVVLFPKDTRILVRFSNREPQVVRTMLDVGHIRKRHFVDFFVNLEAAWIPKVMWAESPFLDLFETPWTRISIEMSVLGGGNPMRLN